MRLGTSLATAGALLGALVTLGAAGSDGASSFRALPGVRDAMVHRYALDTDYWGHTAVVDMRADATRKEIVGALDALRRWKRGPGNGGDDAVRLTVGAGTLEREDEGWDADAHHPGADAVIATARSHARNAANVDLLLRARRVLRAPVTIRSWEWSVTTPDPAATARRIIADPVLSKERGVSLGPDLGWDEDARLEPASLASSETLTEAHLATYLAAVANERLMREGEAHVSFVGAPTNQIPPHTAEFPGAIQIYMSLRLPGSRGPKAFAADPLQDPRWPVVAAQLDLLRDLPRGSSVWVTLEHGPMDGGISPRYSRTVVDVMTGVAPVEGGEKPLWGEAAAAYVGG